MLPRNGIRPEPRPLHAKSQDDMEDERENTKALGNRINQNNNKPKVISASHKTRVSPRPQHSPPQPYPESGLSRQRKQSAAIQNVISTVSNATSAIEANMSTVHRPNLNNFVGGSSFHHGHNSNSHSNVPNSTNQSNVQGTPLRPEDIEQLSEQHDQYIELILEEEEKLIKQHESYIN